ncbi:YggS family pyridoxal phosphate-dependent enzyme [candidate division KSB3 bacterium]|uniref:Pyridoxal phosphate homeostasis protein n=1 Tax=candidate division KSB3 bacterium TaxID=2044937 RepID=A0A9D5JT93_9BACT|nr:YggS family pyridoxal phosphate-dependent enzyme [candidate division KSB3 bacterium]MBD3323674.1 YggS family pyridoxal phosphate-dependent enzyme [candidate division KSB3 bacterium]
MSIKENYQRIRDAIPDEVTIVLAGKTRTPEEIEEAIAAGATDIGENYVQEAEEKFQAVGDHARQVRWHMIGPLQKNKINKALPIFNVVQTVNSLKNAQDINTRAARVGKVLTVYLEINIGEETAKAGIPPDYEQIEQLVRDMSHLNHLSVEGLMTMGPLSGDPEETRPYFRETKKIFDRLAALEIPQVKMQTLSMGMSASYQIAIEEGATMVRLGTIIFGPRH